MYFRFIAIFIDLRTSINWSLEICFYYFRFSLWIKIDLTAGIAGSSPAKVKKNLNNWGKSVSHQGPFHFRPFDRFCIAHGRDLSLFIKDGPLMYIHYKKIRSIFATFRTKCQIIITYCLIINYAYIYALYDVFFFYSLLWYSVL